MNEFVKYETVSQLSVTSGHKELTDEQKCPESLEIDVGKELDKLFPPIFFKEDDEFKVKRASRRQAYPFEVYKLNADLDNVLIKLGKEHTGFSYKVLDVFHGLFDELVRQEIIACPERGLMLASVRKAAWITINYMHKLYKSSFAYGITRDLVMKRDIIQTRNEIPKLIEKIHQAQEKLQNIRNEWEERIRKREEKDRIQTMQQTFMEDQLTITNREMVNQIENIVDAENKWLIDLDSPEAIQMG